MTKDVLAKALHHIRQLTPAPAAGELTDGRLLERFAADQDEMAFALLVERHGPRILGMCLRVLRNGHDAEDAFQGTFLVLARKARSIGRHESLGSWLHAVAYRLALQVTASRPRVSPSPLEDREGPPTRCPLEEQEWRRILDEELNRLPRRYRSAVLLHYLDGQSVEAAAGQLGWSTGQFRGVLFRARQVLHDRLRQRGVGLSAGLLALAARERALAAGLVLATVRAAVHFVAGRSAAAGVVSVGSATLAKGVLHAMFMTKLKIGAAVLLAVIFMGLGVAGTGGPAARAELPAGQPAPSPPADTSPKQAGPIPKNTLEVYRLQQLPTAVGPLRLVESKSKEEVITLSRVTYQLPNAKARALETLLREHVKSVTMETKVEGDTITVTTTPEAQQRVGPFVSLVRGGALPAARTDPPAPIPAYTPVPSRPPAINPPPDDVRGAVTVVDEQTGLVTINIGSDAGVNKGNTLEVYRLTPRPAYVGRLLILAVIPDEAVGKLLGQARAGGVQKGDEVASPILRP
ncbi:hypothetical protein AYO44_01580 [Planctomycetaceae bacterium SCGC AG-212-F19]|nr:hypothetical protein AYO44_01580 [Planctomycetaceae bacterium SCGC AG-212-F19]